MALHAGELVGISLDGRRLISRVGVKVRDSSWGTVLGELSAPEPLVTETGFEAQLQRRHRAPGLDFHWEGTIVGEADGSLTFSMDGLAAGPTAYNRIGICVLHAASSAAGAQFVARGPAGEQRGMLPQLVAPQRMEGETILPMFPAFTALTLTLTDGLRLELEFEGDRFEMEDQRNWTDGSFKVYSTPVGLPVPRTLEAGERLSQRLHLRVGRSAAQRSGTARRPRRMAAAAEIVIGQPTGARLPELGAELDSDGHVPTGTELRRLGGLRLSHLRVSCEPESTAAALRRARMVAAPLGAAIELAVTVSAGGPAAELDRVAASLEQGVSPARVIVLEQGRRRTDPGVVANLRERLAGAGAPPLSGGTDRYFAELNRDRPSMDALDGLAYPVTPQVHDFDDEALIESLAAQSDTVATARSFSERKPVHVSPVTLKPRLNPFATGLPQTLEGQLPAAVDPRQPKAFTAAWTLGSIHRLAAAGAASVTFYELTGWRGLIEREAGSPLPERFPSEPGTPFPVLGVLRTAARWSGADLLATELADPLAAEALALARGRDTLVLVANLCPHERELTVAVSTRETTTLRLGPFAVRAIGSPEAVL